MVLLLQLLPHIEAMFYDTPEDCSWSKMSGEDGGEDGVFLTCQLSSINSRLERTNFSVIPSERTRGLRILCSDESLGRLEPEGFSSLFLLEELEILGCSLESLPARGFWGLPHLKKLSIVSGVAVGVLKVEEGAFTSLSHLQELNLSHNNIRQFPAKELCNLTGLTNLNLSRNEIGSVLDLSLTSPSSSCLSNLTHLDLSSNEITSLETGSLPATTSLSQLLLKDNFIRFISPDVFIN